MICHKIRGFYSCTCFVGVIINGTSVRCVSSFCTTIIRIVMQKVGQVFSEFWCCGSVVFLCEFYATFLTFCVWKDFEKNIFFLFTLFFLAFPRKWILTREKMLNYASYVFHPSICNSVYFVIRLKNFKEFNTFE